MPNIGTILKQEITRLARRELRAELLATKKASAQYRHAIAALKSKVASLEKQIAQFGRRAGKSASGAATESASESAGTPIRFGAKGLKSLRARLGLSAAEMGKVLGVTGQSVYNWELGNARPRAEQIQKIVALRSVGKRDVKKYLEGLGIKPKSRSRAKS
ncbi:MAG: helix-turn-helix domain-containing protein [Burkholderiales bacterium]|nr:helix-turn-helix domain-containing protein [Burkholderiales bacterium]